MNNSLQNAPYLHLSGVARLASTGLDLSLTATGMATYDERGTINDAALVLDRRDHGGQRLRRIVLDLAATLTADVVVVEDLPMHAKSAGLTGQLHGALKYAMREFELRDPILAPPATLKKFATGNGNADKIAMVVAARDRLGYTGTDDNVADALWLAQMGLHLISHPNRVKLPALHLSALDKMP